MKGFKKPFLNQQISICAIVLFGATAAVAKDASEIFSMLCTPCHGKNGEGKKPMGPPLKGSEYIKTSSDADVKKTIQNGRAGMEKKFKDFPSPMPPQKQLTDAELDALVKYLKDFDREVVPTPSSAEIAPAQSRKVAPAAPSNAAETPKIPETIYPQLPTTPSEGRCLDCHKKK